LAIFIGLSFTGVFTTPEARKKGKRETSRRALAVLKELQEELHETPLQEALKKT